MNESETCRQLIEPALQTAGWSWDRQLRLGPGRVNISGGSMYDANQDLVVDYLLRFGQIPLAVLEAKAESEPAADGIQQGQRYTERLGLRFTVASNGHEYILVDRKTGEHFTTPTPPTPGEILQHGLRNEKVIVFCVDDTHAAFFAQELRRVSGDNDYAARITRSERNSHQLERNFQEVGRAKPRVAVTVDLLSTGFDAPDVKVIVFARPVKSSILYKQMKGRGTRLCEDIDKRFFSIFDYSGASLLEDAEFDGHPANVQKPAAKKKLAPKLPSSAPVIQKPVAQGVTLYLAASERFVCLADGRKIPFAEYCEQSKQVIRKISPANLQTLLDLWADKQTRSDIREELKSNDIHVAAFRHYFDLDAADDVDILGKVGFNLPTVPMRHDRVTRFWDRNDTWLRDIVGKKDQELKLGFWETALDHYALYSIDDLERGETYNAPQFTQRIGNFARFLPAYGGGQKLRSDLDQVKHHLYVAH